MISSRSSRMNNNDGWRRHILSGNSSFLALYFTHYPQVLFRMKGSVPLWLPLVYLLTAMVGTDLPSRILRIEKIMDHRIFSSKYFCVFTTCWKPVNSTLPKPGRRTKSFWKWKTITTRDWNSTASGATRFCFPTQHREGTTFRVSGSTRSGVGGTSCARHWSEPAPGERSFRASQDSRFGGQHLLNTRNVRF